MLKKGLVALSAFVAAIAAGGGALLAQAPEEWEVTFQTAHSPTMERITSFNSVVLWIIIAIAVFVFILLAIIVLRFNRKRNPTPQNWSHNTLLEVIWTAVPVIILLAIAIPSFRLLYFADKTVDADMTIKAIGHQWYWTYEYPDLGDVTFDAIVLEDEELEEGQPRLLATDTHVVVPVDTNIRLLTTADDVIHSWAMPSFGVKLDAVPGRVNETWFRVDEEGMYYGQCSELCGTLHGFMPITVEAVSKEAYAAWAETAKEEFASKDAPDGPRLAQAEAE